LSSYSAAGKGLTGVSVLSSFMVKQKELSLRSALTKIENGQLGFCLVTGEEDQFVGIISSADIRRSLLKKLDSLKSLDVHDMINSSPVSIHEDATVIELLQCIKRCSFPVMYLPVLKFGQKSVLSCFFHRD